MSAQYFRYFSMSSRQVFGLFLLKFVLIKFSSIVNADSDFLSFGFTHEPQDTLTWKDQKVIFDCAVHGNFTQIDFRWRKNDTPLDVGRSGGRLSILKNGSLVINSVIDSTKYDSNAAIGGDSSGSLSSLTSSNLETDEGFYQCYAFVNNKWTYVSRKAKLALSSLLRFEDEPQDKTVFVGEIVQFACHSSSKPPPKVTWYKDNLPISPGENKRVTFIPVSGSLHIKNVQLIDQGLYKCKIENENVSKKYRVSKEGHLKVLKNEVLSDSKEPTFVVSPKGQVVTLKDTLVLECAANGFPDPEITWLKDKKNLDLNERVNKFGQGTLVVADVRPEDAGFYTCRASNSENSIDSSATVVVSILPTFKQQPRNLYAKETQDVEFECKADGRPPPSITWLKNGEVIVPSDYFVIDQSKLKIFGLVRLDEAIYQCVAENEAGSAQTSAQLVVESIELSSLNQENQLPSEPLNLKATKIDGRTVALSWESPALNRASLTGYSIYYKKGNSERERVVNATVFSNKEFNVEKLLPNSTYHFRIVAFSKNGPGPSSSVLKVLTKDHSSVPSSVKNLRVTSLTPNSVEIRWDPPVEQDSISFYKLFYVAVQNGETNGHHFGTGSTDFHDFDDDDYSDFDDESEETEIQVNEPWYTLHGLQADTNYEFRVEAVNSHGVGLPSENLVVRTLSDVPSGPPRNLTVYALTADSVVLKWSPPLEKHKNGKIISFKIKYKQKIRGSAMKYLTVDANESQKLVPNLESGATYTFSISASTVNGSGPYSDFVTFHLNFNDNDDSQLLGPPTSLKVEARGTEIHVFWTPPSSDGVGGYKVGWGINVPDVYHERVGPNERSHVIKNLRPNKEYVVSLRAFNKVEGFPIYETVRTSNKPYVDQPRRELKPPVEVRAMTRSHSSIVLTWVDQELPYASARPLDSRAYNVSCSSPALGHRVRHVKVQKTTHTFESLRPNTRYEFAVQLILDGHRSEWSMTAGNQTFPAAPSSAPMDLTIVQSPDNPNSVIINWMPPKHANGVIINYLIYFTNDPRLPDPKWQMEGVRGDRMTTTIDNILPDTEYTFKIQAVNEKGYSPISTTKKFRTIPSGRGSLRISDLVPPVNSGPAAAIPKSGAKLHDSSMVILAAGVIFSIVLCIFVVLVTLYFRRRRRLRGYTAPGGALGGKKEVKPPPDLWIHHDHALELKHQRGSNGHEGKNHRLSSSGSPSLQDLKQLTNRRSPSPPSPDNPPRYHSLTVMPPANGTGTLPRNYRHNVLSPANSGMVDTPPHTARCYPTQQTAPQVVYTGPKGGAHSRDGSSSPFGSGNISGSTPTPPPQVGPQLLDSGGGGANKTQPNSAASTVNRNSNPLKSFTVLANPPPVPPVAFQQPAVAKIHSTRNHFDGSNNRPKLGSGVVIGTKAKSMMQQQKQSLLSNPPPVYTPTPNPNTLSLYASTKDLDADLPISPLERSCSTEELSAQMRNLDNLMKDLNEISANEFDA